MITQLGMGFFAFCLPGFDGVLQALGPENSSLDNINIVWPGASLGQLLQLLGHAGYGRGQKGTRRFSYGECVFSQSPGIRQAAASNQIVFYRLDVLVFGGRLQCGVILDGPDCKKPGIQIPGRSDN